MRVWTRAERSCASTYLKTRNVAPARPFAFNLVRVPAVRGGWDAGSALSSTYVASAEDRRQHGGARTSAHAHARSSSSTPPVLHPSPYTMSTTIHKTAARIQHRAGMPMHARRSALQSARSH
jgi:hypothetical protein